MANRPLRQSALAHKALETHATVAVENPGVYLGEGGGRCQVVLRGDIARAEFAEGVQKALGIAPPAQANTVAASENRISWRSILWLGPDEWLVVCAEEDPAALCAQLEAALEGQHFLLSDVSASRTVITLSGPEARKVLQKGCSLDLHPRNFGPGQCAQASLARCHALLHQRDDSPGYEIYIHRSFADYAWRWFFDAAREYGVQILPEAP